MIHTRLQAFDYRESLIKKLQSWFLFLYWCLKKHLSILTQTKSTFQDLTLVSQSLQKCSGQYWTQLELTQLNATCLIQECALQLHSQQVLSLKGQTQSKCNMTVVQMEECIPQSKEYLSNEFLFTDVFLICLLNFAHYFLLLFSHFLLLFFLFA